MEQKNNAKSSVEPDTSLVSKPKKSLQTHKLSCMKEKLYKLKEDIINAMTDKANDSSFKMDILQLPDSEMSENYQTNSSRASSLLDKNETHIMKKSSIKSNSASSFEIKNKPESQRIADIRSNIIGFNTKYMSPFSIELEAIYADHTASNRAYKSIETMVAYAKRMSANPHTEFSHYGKYSTELMHYARDSLLRSFSASTEDFVALPTGSGSTGAIEKAIKIIKSFECQDKKPIIFLTPYEHHSNILPWVQYYDKVYELASDEEGNLLMDKISDQLIQSPSHKIIVTASAASNVTSKITDLKSLNTVIANARKHKDIIFSVDCAAFCCHHELNFQVYDQIDFAHLSPHKNLGGAESCGVLIARKSIVRNAKPTFPGGGTVAFVKGYSKQDILYDVDIFNREIAGTPPFLGFYRAALSYELLKNHIGYETIHRREKSNTELFMSLINAANKDFRERKLANQIVIYGDKDFNKRANVITLNILSEGKLVQHSFASLMFTDVFGIQLRSGCFCAGPFGIQLLKLDEETAKAIEEEVSVGIMKGKPGYLRLDLSFYLQHYEIEYLAKAIIGVAEYCRNMELVYTICSDGEIKRHQLFKTVQEGYSMDDCDKMELVLEQQARHAERKLKDRQESLKRQLERGLAIVKSPINFLRNQKLSQQ